MGVVGYVVLDDGRALVEVVAIIGRCDRVDGRKSRNAAALRRVAELAPERVVLNVCRLRLRIAEVRTAGIIYIGVVVDDPTTAILVTRRAVGAPVSEVGHFIIVTDIRPAIDVPIMRERRGTGIGNAAIPSIVVKDVLPKIEDFRAREADARDIAAYNVVVEYLVAIKNNRSIV